MNEMPDKNSDYIYRLENILHEYNQFTLDIPELMIEKGSSLGFIGPNGCGKSTLFRILAMLETPTSGNIFFEDRCHNIESITKRKEVTLLLQEPYLLKRSVFENVAYGVRMNKEKSCLKQRVLEALNWVGLPPEKYAGKRWSELSGGEAQRVALASRLVLKPKALILDEPTSNIDRMSTALIKDAILKHRNRYNTTLIISSHDYLWLNSIAERIYRLHKGRIVGSGAENIIEGPWCYDKDDLWSKTLSDGNRIYATRPPYDDSVALLNPYEIIISDTIQSGMSAQNMLKGRITALTTAKEFDSVSVEVDVSGISLTSYVTQYAVKNLQLFPGKDVWIIFKASSLNWQ